MCCVLALSHFLWSYSMLEKWVLKPCYQETKRNTTEHFQLWSGQSFGFRATTLTVVTLAKDWKIHVKFPLHEHNLDQERAMKEESVLHGHMMTQNTVLTNTLSAGSAHIQLWSCLVSIMGFRTVFQYNAQILEALTIPSQ